MNDDDNIIFELIYRQNLFCSIFLCRMAFAYGFCGQKTSTRWSFFAYYPRPSLTHCCCFLICLVWYIGVLCGKRLAQIQGQICRKDFYFSLRNVQIWGAGDQNILLSLGRTTKPTSALLVKAGGSDLRLCTRAWRSGRRPKCKLRQWKETNRKKKNMWSTSTSTLKTLKSLMCDIL